MAGEKTVNVAILDWTLANQAGIFSGYLEVYFSNCAGLVCWWLAIAPVGGEVQGVAMPLE